MNIIYMIIIILLLILLLKKQVLNFFEKIRIRIGISKIFYFINKFVYKFMEIFWIIALGLVILLPIFVYYVGTEFCYISYNEYKELLDITLNSYYVISIGVIIIVYLFRNQLKRKIEQLSEVNPNGMKFDQDSQTVKNLQNSQDNVKSNNMDMFEIKENIYEEIKESFSKGKQEKKEKIDLELENEQLKQHIEELENNLKIEKFMIIQNRMARTTNVVLLYINSKYKYNNFFRKLEIEGVLKEVIENKKLMKLKLETIAVYQFLENNGIIDCEKENEFSVTGYGQEFLKFLFEGEK